MNRFKVTIAKEKILRLREKYSKNVNQEEANSSSESIMSMKSDQSTDQEKQQTTIFKKTALPYSGNNVSKPTISVKEDLTKEETVKEEILKADFELCDNVIQESKFDIAEQSFEKPLSPGSVVLSDLSNQFERIRFISSSNEDISFVESEDLSIIKSENTPSIVESDNIPSVVESENTPSVVESENTSSILESKNTKTNSISTNVIPSVKVPKQNNKSSNEEIAFPKIRENFKTYRPNPTEINSSIKSLSKSESNDSTKISSIKELINSESEARHISHDASFLECAKDSNEDIKFDENVDSTDYPFQKNEIGKLSSNISFTSILEKKSSVSAAMSKVREIGTDAGSDIFKIYKSNKNETKQKSENERKNISSDNISMTKTSPKALNLQSASAKHTKYNDYVNKSTNTDPVKVTLLKNRSKHHQQKPAACITRPTGKIEKNKHIQFSKKQDFRAKQNNKRSFIKPCNLLNKDEIRNIESKGVIHQESQSLKYSLLDDFYNYPISVATSAITCDEVITLLLRNQIQLTRHFIESHHRMYLQVCQATQLLNEKHSPSQ